MSVSVTRGGTRVRRDGFEEAFLRERLGQVLIRSHHPTPARSNKPSLDESITTACHETRIFLDERTGLVTVEARHHDVDEYQVG
jgi:hypothetical protein